MIQKIKLWLCRNFGHTFNLVDLTILDIMQRGAINKEEFKNETINCERCGVSCSFTSNMVGLYENKDEFDLI